MAKQKGTTDAPSTNGAAPTEKESERLPAYFLSLTLENVRCFGPKQTLDLSDGSGKPARWTIILGLNGTGKTTLLQSLAGFELIPNVFSFESDTDKPNLLWFSPRATSEQKPHFHAGLREESLRATLVAQVALSPSLELSPAETAECSIELEQNTSKSKGLKKARSIWCIAYGAGRRVGSVALSATEEDTVATPFSERAELRNPEEWLLQLDYAAKSDKHNKDAQQRFALAKELLLAIMPEGEITDIQCVPGSGPNPKARAEFHTPYGWVPLRQLGYGYQTLITWVADLANRMAERYPDSKNPLAEPAVVLVDEIDLHLHPKWQRKLMGFLTDRFPNTQFIATAHSPLVAQAAADANIAVLRREGDHVLIDNDVDDIRNWRIDQILTSDLFGLETARPPHVEEWMAERNKLLEKSRLNAAEKRRLEELNALLDELPFGETAQERNERATIKSALDALTKASKPAP